MVSDSEVVAIIPWAWKEDNSWKDLMDGKVRDREKGLSCQERVVSCILTFVSEMTLLREFLPF